MMEEIHNNVLGAIMKEDQWKGFVTAEDFKEGFRMITDMLDKSKVCVVSLNHEFKVMDANASFAGLLGYTHDEIKELHVWDWNPQFKKDALENQYADRSEANLMFEEQVRRKDGSLLDVLTTVDAKLIGGEVISFCIVVDQTEKKKLERQLKRDQARLQSFVENSQDILFTIDRDLKITYISPNALQRYRTPSEEIVGRKALDLVIPAHRSKFEKMVRSLFQGVIQHGSLEYQIGLSSDKADRKLWISTNFSLTQEEDGTPLVLGISRDIEEQKAYESHLIYLSFHDSLTGLYNRAYYEDAATRFEVAIRNYPITVFSMDIDGLKEVNDTLGHHAGDQLIIQCADFLRSVFREGDLLARVGGDEFVALLPRTGQAYAMEIQHRLETALEEYNRNRVNPLSVSMGWATAFNETQSVLDAYLKADEQLRDVKSKRTASR